MRGCVMRSETAPKALSAAYRTVWRWHFYAGLLVLPILMLMALTGGLYLFKDEIDGALWRDMARVEARTTTASPDRWIASAEVGTGGRAASVRVPDRPDEAVRVTVERPDGTRLIAFVDPHDAQLTGITPQVGVTETIKRLHSLALFGTGMTVVVEIVAGWTIVLVATGIFLWWPRGRAVGVVSIKASGTGRRPFWRDLHAVTGLYAGGIIAFLAVTGMPWSVVWGDQVMGAIRDTGLGRPPAPVSGHWQKASEHADHADHPEATGWTMEGKVALAMSDGTGRRLSTVLDTVRAEAMPSPYIVSIPKSADLAYTVAHQTRTLEDTRSLYVDGGDGTVLADIGYAQFGAGAKAVEWGIFVHQGTQYGQINRIVMLSGCIAVWLLGISAAVMWWKRRPKGRLAAPVAPPGPRAKAAVLGIVLPLCILYPLTGLSLLVAVLLDRAVAAIRRPRPAAS